jgi:hypothetical protein
VTTRPAVPPTPPQASCLYPVRGALPMAASDAKSDTFQAVRFGVVRQGAGLPGG